MPQNELRDDNFDWEAYWNIAEKFQRHFEQAMFNIATAFAVPSHYFTDEKLEYRWQRLPRESVREWGSRLQKRELLDDPTIRWEYQKAVWKALWRRR